MLKEFDDRDLKAERLTAQRLAAQFEQNPGSLNRGDLEGLSRSTHYISEEVAEAAHEDAITDVGEKATDYSEMQLGGGPDRQSWTGKLEDVWHS